MGTHDALDDEALLAAARADDEDAFRELCVRYEAVVKARIRDQLGAALQRKVSIVDVFQEALVHAHARLDEFEHRGDGAFGAWVAKIAEYKAREAVKRYAGTEKRDVGREVSRGARPDTQRFLGAMPSPSQLAMASERGEAIRAALQALPEDYRRVIELMQGEGLDLDGCAAQLGRSRQATAKLYSRALSRLAELAVPRE